MSVNLIGVLVIFVIYLIISIYSEIDDWNIKRGLLFDWYLIIMGLWDVACCCFLDSSSTIGVLGIALIVIGAQELRVENK